MQTSILNKSSRALADQQYGVSGEKIKNAAKSKEIK